MSGEALSRSLSALGDELASLGKQEFSLSVRTVNAAQTFDDIDPENHDQIPIEMKLQQEARISELERRRSATS